MKFINKYPNPAKGQKYSKDWILVGEYKPCVMCDELTPFIDIDCESYFCSEECRKEFYDWMNALNVFEEA